MGKIRFLYENLIPESGALTASEGRIRYVTRPQKTGDGSATMEQQNVYVLDERRDYYIEIDSVSAGNSVGEATFKWSNDGGATFEATGVTTSTALTLLEDEIYVVFTAGTGNDFELGDRWDFRTYVPFHPDGLVDGNRDTEWRSLDVADAINIVADLGSAQTVDAVALLDHNFSSGATITLEANTTDSWGAVPLSESLTWQSGKILKYLTTTPRSYRYWRLVVTDTGNTNPYLQISEWFLGTYFEPTRDVDYRHVRRDQATLRTNPGGRGPDFRKLERRQAQYQVQFTALPSTDIDAFQTMFDYVADLTNRKFRSFLVNWDSADTSDFHLVTWTNPYERQGVGTSEQTTVPMELLEEVRSRA